MRKLLIAGVALILSINAFSQTKVSCQIDFNIKGLENKKIIFASEYGQKQLVLDTILLNTEGKGTYSNKHRLTGGIYVILLPNQKYFELLINDEQFFTVSTDTADYIGNMTIEGADEPELFRKYTILALDFEKKMKQSKDNRDIKDSSKFSQHSKDMAVLSVQKKAINTFTIDVLNDKPNTFMAAYLRMKEDVELPENMINNSRGASRDFFQMRYQFIKKHYFDNVVFNDIRLLRTRLLYEKLNYFFNVFITQEADSICNEMNNLLLKAKVNDESYKYVLNFLNTNYRMPKNHVQERVLVYLADNYYLNGKAPWADPRFIKLFQEKVDAIRPSLVGVKAADLNLQTIDEEDITLYGLKADYLVVLFWSPDCSVCKMEIPKLYEAYKKHKSKGLKVLAVYTHADKQIWQNELSEKKYDWINAYDPLLKSNFAKKYSVDVTPKIYLLDKDKKILAKGNNALVINRYLNDK